MRAVLLVLAACACGPKPSTTARVFEDDLDLAGREFPAATTAPEPPSDPPREIAPPGQGRRTGAISRDRLVAVLDAGPGAFLRQLEVTARLAGDRFVGWELVQLIDPAGPLHGVDVAPGDVLLAVNGQPLARPEQLQQVWDSLRTANELTAQIWRGDQRLELRFTIEPPIR